MADTATPASDLEVMRGIIEQAREAIWCIRFERPVDVTKGEDATVDQIFSNPAVWTMCNAAMARAYELPSETELNGRDVHFHWPRNAVNEAFVRADITRQKAARDELAKLSLVASATDDLVIITDAEGRTEWVNEAFIRAVISSGFRIDGAVSEDFRRDGTAVLMENDVRALVEDGHLHRLWGTLRELRPRAVQPVPDSLQGAALGFDLLPLPACLVSSEGTLLAGNAAWRQSFGLAGAEAARMILRSAAAVAAAGEFVLPLPLASGATLQHIITVSWHSPQQPTQDDGPVSLLAATARAMTSERGDAA